MEDLETAEYCQQLARILQARVPADQAAAQAAEASDNRRFHQVTQDIVAELQAGQPLSKAMSSLLDPMHGRILEAGEATDEVPAMLLSCAQNLRQRNRLTSRLRTMLGYPILIVFCASGVLLFFLQFIFGELLPLMPEGADNYLITNLFLGLHRLVPLFLVFWIVSLGWVLALQFGGARTRPLLAWVCRWLPGYRHAHRARDHARLTSLMASFVDSGQSLPDGLGHAVMSVEDTRLRRRLDVAATEICEGRDPGEALRAAKVDGLIPLLLGKAPTAQLASELHELAALYTVRADQAERAAHTSWTVVLFVIMVAWVLLCLAGIILPLVRFTGLSL